MRKIKLRYLKQERSRHGKPRLYVRRPGRKMIRPPVDDVDDPAFGPAYAAALAGESLAPAHKPQAASAKPAQGSLRDLCTRYVEFLSKDKALADRTKYIRRRHLDEVCREPVKPGDPRTIGDIPRTCSPPPGCKSCWTASGKRPRPQMTAARY